MKHEPRFKRLLYDAVKAEKKLEDQLNEIGDEGYNLHTVIQTPQGIMFIFEHDAIEIYSLFDRAHEALKEIAALPEESEAKNIATTWLAEKSPYHVSEELLTAVAGNVTKD